MTNSTPSPRYFGRCVTRGCKRRRVIDERAPHTKLFPGGPLGGTLTVLAEDGRDWPLYEIGNRDQAAAMRRAGFVCPEHDAPVYFRPARFSYNPEKVCNSKFIGATGPACDCSCSGTNHGGSHL